MLSKITRHFTVWAKKRQMTKELESLSNKELSDIGVSRFDIPRIVREAYVDK